MTTTPRAGRTLAPRGLGALLALVLGVGCPTQESEPAPTPQGLADARAELLTRWLAGEFDSTEQADEDPRYFAISLSACPVTAPSLGERALYVEQAYMDDLENPYRQRIYTVQAPAEDDATASTTVYALEAPGDLVGACGDGEVPTLDAADVALRPGCGVVVQWSADEDTFVGGTEGMDCASSINGASYATSDVRIEADLISSWDRGFDDVGEQVWGATAGPYVFRRR